jgi:hypothetical protein
MALQIEFWLTIHSHVVKKRLDEKVRDSLANRILVDDTFSCSEEKAGRKRRGIRRRAPVKFYKFYKDLR